MIRSEKMILKKTDEIGKWLVEATAIYNQTLYYFRQESFAAQKEKRKIDYSKLDLYKLVKETSAWKSAGLDINAKQYVIRKVNDNWKSFCKACKAYAKNKNAFTGQPKMPKYLKHGRCATLIFDKTRLRHKDLKLNRLSLPKSRHLIQFPDYLQISKIKCITVKEYYGKVKLGISYEKDVKTNKLNNNKYLGIDIGVDNIVAIATDNQTNKSWIVKGGNIKSINQFYNKKLAKYKSLLEKVNNQKTSHRINRLSIKRHNMLDYEFHCISKKIINLCIENNIGNVIIGHNNGWKQGCGMGRKNNQRFVQIPFNQLISKIQYKAEEAGINVMLTEESYTSKIDHLANEKLEKHDIYLGKRIKRGLFKSSTGKILNADVNGAIGILRKKNVFSDADLIGLRDRGDVVSPLVLKYKP